MTARPAGVRARPDGLPRQRRVRRPEPCARSPRTRPSTSSASSPRRRGRPAAAGLQPSTPVARGRRALGVAPVLTPARLRDPDAIAAILGLEPDLARPRRLRPDRAAGAARTAARRAEPPPVAAAAASRRVADPGRDPGRRSRDRRHPDADGRRASTPARSSPSSAVPLDRRRDGAGARGAPRDRRGRPPGRVARAVAARRARGHAAAGGRRDADPAAAPRGRPARPVAAGAELERQVRAYQPWPGTFLEADGERLVVGAASVAASRPDDVPGRLVRDGDLPALTTADGRLVLERGPAAGPPADVRSGLPAGPPDVARGLTVARSPCQNRLAIGRMTPRPPRRSPVRGSAASRPRTSRPGSPSAASRPTARARSLDAVWGGQAAGFDGDPDAARRRCATSSRPRSGFDTVADTRGPRGRRRPDREGAPPARRRARSIESVLMHYPARGGSRERHTLCILEPGRLRGRLPVLRDRRARASSATSRRPRSSTRSATPPGAWRPTASA